MASKVLFLLYIHTYVSVLVCLGPNTGILKENPALLGKLLLLD